LVAGGWARRSGAPMALAYLDIDHFKRINDTHGHAVGDLVLKEFARRLQANVRATDTVARLSGDEFVIILEDLKTEQEATSVGIALHSGAGQTREELLAKPTARCTPPSATGATASLCTAGRAAPRRPYSPIG
jgi:diguanylate cyclase (GGDEF)-like protein